MAILSDWELWACARHQLVKHGDLAPEAAAQRVYTLLAEGDLDGHKVWLAILDRIRQLEGPVQGETSH